MISTRAAILGSLVLMSACSTPPRAPDGPPPCGARLERRGDEIVVAGQLFHTGTRVVLWLDPGGYDAYRVEPRFPSDGKPRAKLPEGARYGTLRRHIPATLRAKVQRCGWTLEDLRSQVHQFVLHYDVCGTSRQCFKVLQDLRGLSVHFMLDVDGTIYQTLDLKERAWHAGVANDRSIGIEIAQIGAYSSPEAEALQEWYRSDAQGMRIVFPSWMKETGIATAEFVGRPARPGILSGEIHGKTYYQLDFTAEQYDALAHLLAAVHAALPRIALEYPRDSAGELLRRELSTQEREAFCGVLGHWHVTRNKIDPGPALDWDLLLERARGFSLAPAGGIGVAAGSARPLSGAQEGIEDGAGS